MNNPVMKADTLNRIQIRRKTETVLKDFCPQALNELIPLDIEEMFDLYIPKRFRITTKYENLSFGIHGYTDPNNLESAVSSDLVDADDQPTRRFARSTIGHEIGHIVLHAIQFKKKNLESKFLHDKNHSKTTLFRQTELRPIDNPEWQAWEFCKSLFLPEFVFRNAIESGMNVEEIAKKVDLNPAFIKVRMKNLKMD